MTLFPRDHGIDYGNGNPRTTPALGMEEAPLATRAATQGPVIDLTVHQPVWTMQRNLYNI